jgi:hypothetical protein
MTPARHLLPLVLGVLTVACDGAVEPDAAALAHRRAAFEAADTFGADLSDEEGSPTAPSEEPDVALAIAGPDALAEAVAAFSAADPSFAERLAATPPPDLDLDAIRAFAIPAAPSPAPREGFTCNDMPTEPKAPPTPPTDEVPVAPRLTPEELAPNRDIFSDERILDAVRPRRGDRPTPEARARHARFLEARCELAREKAAAGDAGDLVFCGDE